MQDNESSDLNMLCMLKIKIISLPKATTKKSLFTSDERLQNILANSNYFHSVKLVTVPVTGKHRLSFYVQERGDEQGYAIQNFYSNVQGLKKIPSYLNAYCLNTEIKKKQKLTYHKAPVMEIA